MLTDLSQTEEWFKARFNLANFLLDDTSKSESIENAIEILNDLLTYISQETDTEKWAYINLAMGFAYDQRIKGDKHNNLKKVITHYNQALIFFTKEKYPEKWAVTKAGIGLAYSEIKKGNHKENILKAIEYYSDAIGIFTEENYPEDYKDSVQQIEQLRIKLGKIDGG